MPHVALAVAALLQLSVEAAPLPLEVVALPDLGLDPSTMVLQLTPDLGLEPLTMMLQVRLPPDLGLDPLTMTLQVRLAPDLGLHPLTMTLPLWYLGQNPCSLLVVELSPFFPTTSKYRASIRQHYLRCCCFRSRSPAFRIAARGPYLSRPSCRRICPGRRQRACLRGCLCWQGPSIY